MEMEIHVSKEINRDASALQSFLTFIDIDCEAWMKRLMDFSWASTEYKVAIMKLKECIKTKHLRKPFVILIFYGRQQTEFLYIIS